MPGSRVRGFLSVAVIFGLALGLGQDAARSPRGATSPPSTADEPVPAYHAQVPMGALPATMTPALFPEPVVQNAYAIAAKIKKTLYQQPCYCHCDRGQGHASLLDCFASKHRARCNICIKADCACY